MRARTPRRRSPDCSSALFRRSVRKFRKTGTGIVVKSRSLSWRLGVSTLAAVLPLAAFALIMVGWIAYSEREAESRMLVGDAYSLAKAVGREISADFLLADALSHSAAAAARELGRLRGAGPGHTRRSARGEPDRFDARRPSCVDDTSACRRIRLCFATGQAWSVGRFDWARPFSPMSTPIPICASRTHRSKLQSFSTAGRPMKSQ